MKGTKKWIKLSNGYWLKILLFRPRKCMWCYDPKLYLLDICVGKTKRIVNDHYNCTSKSPKRLWQKSTNKRGGLEALLKTIEYVEELSTRLPKGSIIRVEGSDDKRTRAYRRLLKYGFKEANFYAPNCRWHKGTYYFKVL